MGTVRGVQALLEHASTYVADFAHGTSPSDRAYLLGHMRELLRAEALHDEILDSLREIAACPDVDKRKVISSIELVLAYDADGLSEEVTTVLTAVRND